MREDAGFSEYRAVTWTGIRRAWMPDQATLIQFLHPSNPSTFLPGRQRPWLLIDEPLRFRVYSGSVMRLFVAIALEGEAATVLDRVRERLAVAGEDLRWSRTEDRHITLQFLGEVSPERAACFTERLGAIRSPHVPVQIASLGFFVRAGVFRAGVGPTAELLALQQRVTVATRVCGLVAEPRPYRPHITLARTRGRAGSAALAALEQALKRSSISLATEFTAQEFLLIESFPGPEGSRYEVRIRFALD